VKSFDFAYEYDKLFLQSIYSLCLPYVEMDTLTPISKYKVWRKYYLYAFVIIAIVTFFFIFYYQQRKTVYSSEVFANENNKVAEETSFLISNMERCIHDLHFLSEMNNVVDLILGDTEKCSTLEHIYISYIKNYYGVNQLRLINAQGDEVFRINNTEDGIYIVPENELQNKRDRYYFKETLALGRGDSYISDVNLNFEKGVVEIPYNPVLRFAVPVYDSDEKAVGVLVVNYSASVFLRQIKGQNLYFFNGSKKLIAGPTDENKWAFYISDDVLGEDVEDQSSLLGVGNHGDNTIRAYRIIVPELFHEGETSEHISMESNWIIASVIKDYHLRSTLMDLRTFLIICYVSLLIVTLLVTEILARVNYRNYYTKRALELSDEKFKAIAHSSPGIIFQWFETFEGKRIGLSYISKKVEDLLGIKDSDLLKDSSLLKFYQKDRKVLVKELMQSKRTLNDFKCEVRVYDSSETLRWYRIVACVQKTTEQYLFNGVMMDITEEKNIEEERLRNQRETEHLAKQLAEANIELSQKAAKLMRLNEEKSEFLSIASHDLKNPLSAIVGLSEFLREMLDGVKSEKKQKGDLISFVDMISQSSQHMRDIVDGILNHEAIESGKLVLNLEETDLTQVIRDVYEQSLPLAQQKQIQLQLNIPRSMMVEIDPIKIREVIDNFLSNAIKFSSDNKHVWINLEYKEEDFIGKIRVSVKDEGPGLNDKDKDLAFGRFQKLSARPTGGENSTGLGLSIAKKLIEAHNGEIGVESELGHGAEFYFTLFVRKDPKYQI